MGKNRVALTRLGEHAVVKQREESVATVKPFADVYETDDAYVLKLDLPGVAKDKIDLTIQPGRLTVRAAVEPYVSEEKRVLFREITPNKVYYREFHLGEDADHNKVEAHIEDAVLTITIGKTESAKAKHVPIQ